MARMTEDELIKAALDSNMSSEEALAFFEKELAGGDEVAPVSASAPSVRAVRPSSVARPAVTPRPAAPRPAAPRPVAQAQMVTMAAPRVTVPVPVEPAMEAMVAPVRPIAAPAPVPVAAPAVPDARLKAEEEIQLAQMLDEQRAIREQQNVQWARQPFEPLQTLLGPGLALVRGAAPVAGPLAPAVAAGTVGLAALAPVAGAAASGLSKLGAYGRVEATPAMREEARRRAQAAVQRQQFVAEEPNSGETFLATAEDFLRPYAGLLEDVKAIPEAARRLRDLPAYQKYEQMAAGGRGKVLTPKVGPQNPEEFALYKGGQFAENLKRVQSAPDQLIAVGQNDGTVLEKRKYEQIVSPKVAATNYPKEFEAWSKRFPEQAKKIREEISKAGDAGRISNKLAAGTVPSAAALEVPQAERESLVRIAAMGKPVPLPTPEELGVSDAQWLAALRKAGVPDTEVEAGLLSADVAERLRAALAAP